LPPFTGKLETIRGLAHCVAVFNGRTAKAISEKRWIRNCYMNTPFLRIAFQVIIGGVCVLLVGILSKARATRASDSAKRGSRIHFFSCNAKSIDCAMEAS